MRAAVNLLGDAAASAASSLNAHGMRSCLTSLGIAIGVAAVIVIVAIMESLSSKVTMQLDDLASDTVTLQAYTSQEDLMLGIENGMKLEDFRALDGRVDGVADMTKIMRGQGFLSDVTYERQTVRTRVFGTDSSYDRILSIFPEKGRFISESDDLRKRRVAFIGKSIVSELNLPDNPVGEFINISGDWFLIVGVAEARGKLFGLDQDDYIILPFSVMRAMHGEDALESVAFMFRPEPGADLERIKLAMTSILRKRHKLEGDDPDDFEFVSSERIKSGFDSIKRSVSLVAGGVVGISLIVGGIGIMNIMLVSVSERTREIGILKAIGATPGVILLQFLIEAALLSLGGGFIGVLLGYFVISTLEMLTASTLVVPLWSVALALLFTSALGVSFGLAPAVKAAKLRPISALRHE